MHETATLVEYRHRSMDDNSAGIDDAITVLGERITARDHVGAASHLRDLRQQWRQTPDAFPPKLVTRLS